MLQTLYNYHSLQHTAVKCIFSTIIQSRWPCGLWHMSAAMRLLRLWVQILPVIKMSVVSVVCCQMEISVMG
jgi:hypothetical protein